MRVQRIDNQDYSLFRDYDKGKFHFLSYEGRIEYLAARVRLSLTDPCEACMAEAETNYMGLILTTAICAGISAAGTFLRGKRASKKGEDKKFFVAFIARYMDPVLKEKYPHGGTWASWLYHRVRCGLSHGFAIDEGGIELGLDSYVSSTSNGPELDPRRLLKDFTAGWSQYLQEVRAGGEQSDLGRRFKTRFDAVFYD